MFKNNPRISINKLGEYCEANSLRRKQIVYDAKHPTQYKTTRYSDVRDAIKEFLINDMNYSLIDSTQKNITERKTNNDYQLSDKENSIEALRVFKGTDLSVFKGVSFEPFTLDNTCLNIAGVDISVYPDLLAFKSSGDKNFIGGVKIHITKEKLKQESQKIIAAILYRYIDDFIEFKDHTTDLNMCFSMDVFSRQLESSPYSYKRRMGRVEASCEEIALWWYIL